MKFIFGLFVVVLLVCYAKAGKKEKVHIKIIVPKYIKDHKHTKTVYVHKHPKKKHEEEDHGHKDEGKKQHHVVHHYHYHKAQHEHKGSQKHHHDLKHEHKHKGSHEHKGHLGHDHKGKFSHDNKGKFSHSHKKEEEKKKDDGHKGHGHAHKLVYFDDDHSEFNNYEDNSREDNLDKDNFYYYNNDKSNPLQYFDADSNDKLSHRSLRSELVEVSNYGDPNVVVVKKANKPLSKFVSVTSGYQVQEDHDPHDHTTKSYDHFNGLSHYSDTTEEEAHRYDGDYEETQGFGGAFSLPQSSGSSEDDEEHFRKVDEMIGRDTGSDESRVSPKFARFQRNKF